LTGEYKEKNEKRIAHGKACFNQKYGGVFMGEYKSGMKDGLIKEKDRKGNTDESEMKENEKHGYSLANYNTRSVESCYYWQGERHGLYLYKCGWVEKETHRLYEGGKIT
jgi:hypothetical protein